MASVTLLICGSRDYGKVKQEREAIFRALDALCWSREWILSPDEDGNWLPNVRVISGKAPGVDTAAIDWAINSWCDFQEYPADWDKHGKAAGPIRNKQMIDEGKPDYVIAFKGGKGTANMIKQAKEAGIPVIEIDWSNT